jgi:hypothetical protein
MTQTLTHGWQKPERGDKGDPIFDALEFNIDQLDTHKHDGNDSAKVPSSRIGRVLVSVPVSGWTAGTVNDNTGDYRNLFFNVVNFPSVIGEEYQAADDSGYDYANMVFTYVGGSNDGKRFHPTIRKLSDTSFELYSPVNNQAYAVAFT